MNALDRTIAAEARAVEEGHRAFLRHDDDGPYVRVVSDTHLHKEYRVTARSTGTEGDPIAFTCVPRKLKAFEDDHLHVTGAAGHTPCKHAAVAARRLEREGLARFSEAGWVITDKAAAIVAATIPTPSDPFEGLV